MQLSLKHNFLAPFASALPRARGGSKRAMDIALILMSLPVLIPVFAVIAALLAAQGAPVLYAQDRVGRGGRGFRLWKFRTMVPRAEEMLAQHLATDAAARAEWLKNCKLRADPRVTGLGRFLRATSLDELPQLWNVLRGEMSLVGPRPVPRGELARNYGEAASAYLKCRPGLTGLWQVSGRNRLSYAARVELDRYYAQNRSPRLDLVILVMTFAVVLRADGM